jgi:hypothetical protein
MEKPLTYEQEITKLKIRQWFWLTIYGINIFAAVFDLKDNQIANAIIGTIFSLFAVIWASVAHIELNRLQDRLDMIKHKENVDNKHNLD